MIFIYIFTLIETGMKKSYSPETKYKKKIKELYLNNVAGRKIKNQCTYLKDKNHNLISTFWMRDEK